MPNSSSNIPPNRLPAPSLFVAPPSRNPSNLDLSLSKSQTASTSKDARSQSPRAYHDKTVHITPSAAIPGPTSPLPQRSSSPQKADKDRGRDRGRTKNKSADYNDPPSLFPPPPPDPTAPFSNNLLPSPRDPNQLYPASTQEEEQRRRPRRSTAILDAHWAALQSTLSDIELSASGAGHVFGGGHATALEDLRKAQVELARAWGPKVGSGEEDDGASVRPATGESGTTSLGTTATMATTLSSTEKSGSRVGTAGGKSNVSGGTKGAAVPAAEKTRDAKERDADLDAAEQRRKESDAYFRRVKEGVEEVVKKLEGVSAAMRNVEMESREIWGDGGSGSGSSELDSGSVRS